MTYRLREKVYFPKINALYYHCVRSRALQLVTFRANRGSLDMQIMPENHHHDTLAPIFNDA